jgi:2'-5' RNA ligase
VTIRAFIAVELDDSLRREVARVQEKVRAAVEGAGGAKIAWVRPESMHLTLKFLGDIDESIVSSLHTSVVQAIRDNTPINVPLSRLGAFPRLQDPHNLWLGPDDRWQHGDESRRLQALVRAIDACCAPQGIAPEARPFSPHLTLGRVKAGERQIGRALVNQPGVTQPLPLPLLAVSTVTLMKSQLNSKGAIHTPLWRAPLR